MSAESMIRARGQTCTIQRKTTANDALGYPKVTWANHLTSVAIDLQPNSGNETERYGGDTSRRFGRAFVLFGQDIKSDDRIVMTSPDRTMDIQFAFNHGRTPMTRQMVLDWEETIPEDSELVT